MAKNLEVVKQEFPIWYSKVSLGEDKELVQKRLTGVLNLAQKINTAIIEALIRVVFKTRQAPNADAIASIRQFFRDSDELFEIQGNDAEMEVLCGASLRAVFGWNDNDAATAALSVTSASFCNARTLNLPMDLLTTAEHTLTTVAGINRERPDLVEEADAAVPAIDFTSAIAKIEEQWNTQGVSNAFTEAASTITKALTKLAKQQQSIISSANSYISVQDEELQMLWWLVGGRSWDLECPFSKIPAEAQPLVLAKELAGFTQFLPGPSSVKGLLSMAGLKETKKVTIPSVVNACDENWLNTFMDNLNPSPVTQPVHFAIKGRLDTGDNTSWVAAWEATTGIKSTHAVSMLDMGNQFYRERLLATFGEA